MATQTFPHVNIDIQDNSGGSVVSNAVVPLHLPIFFIQAEQGPLNTPVLGTLAMHQAVFGINTFDPTQAFFSHQTLFAMQALQYQQVYLVRVADPTVAQANLVVQLTMNTASIPQYQVDALGAQILDGNGNPMPQLDASGNPISAPGYTMSWSTRPLADGEAVDQIQTVVSQSGSVTTWVYPILGILATSPGSAPNRSGFSFYVSADASTTTETNISSQLYRFAPVVLAPSNTGTTSSVTDIFSQIENDVSLKAVAIDPTTAEDMSMNGILSTNYVDNNGNSLLNYAVTVYSSSVSAIGQALIDASPELTGIDPFLINILSGVDENQNPYQHFQVLPSVVGNPDTVLYLAGGSDGLTDRVSFENLVANFVQSDDTTDFQDYFRFPFTHFYDSGFSLTNKYALMNILALRDDVSGTFSTQDTSEVANTQAQDQSAGAAILSRARTYPESVLFGTPAMRVEIYQQCGQLAVASAYNGGLVPCTLDRMIKRCTYYSATYVKGTPKGRPNSEVTLFKKVNWTAATATQKQLNWDTALNTIGYADIQTLFYPDLRSIYVDQTSLLSDAVFVDYLIFLKHIARNKWTYYAGRDDNATKLFTLIAQDIDTTANTVFGSLLPTSTVVSQTDADQKAGYSTTVTISVTGDLPQRVWNVVIPVSRTAPTKTT